MLLSIVECDDYKLWKNGITSDGKSISYSEEIEIIGPVLGINIANMRNQGALRAQGDWIFFKDKDCDIEPRQVLAILKNSIKIDKNIAAIGGVYSNKSHSKIESCYNLIQRKWVYSGLINKIQRNVFLANHLLGGAYLIKKNILLQLKGFNEEIGWGGEESELTSRIQKMGYKTIVNYNLKVAHHNKLNLRGFLKRAWQQNFNKGKFKIYFDNKKTKNIYLRTKTSFYIPTIVYLSTAIMALKLGQLVGRTRQFKRHLT